MECAEVLVSPQEIRSAISASIANGEFAIAVAYWGGDAYKAIGLDGDLRGRGRILCNLSSGACDPNVIRNLISRGADVRSLSKLHAKAYIGSGRAVIGSSNASNRGLGLVDGCGWSEACVSVEGAKALKGLRSWFDELWAIGADLSDPHIHRLLLDAADLNYRQSAGGEPMSLLDALRASPERFARVRLYVTLDWEAYGRAVENQVEFLQGATGEDIDAWENWPGMPANAQILSFHYSATEKKKFSYGGAWQTPVDPSAAIDPVTNGTYVFAVPRIMGRFELGDNDAWLRGIRRLKRRVFQGSSPDEDAATMHILDFAKQFLS